MSDKRSASSAKPVNKERARNLLEDVVRVAKEHGTTGLVVFDLDSTLLDNSPRQARIMREYGESAGHPALATVTAEHWNGWDAKIPMRRVGLDEAAIAEHFDPFRQYWFDRFFTSDYCVDDRAIPGAIQFVESVLQTAARIFYVTGRHEPMRDGTVLSFKREGFPIPDGEAIQLIMKPSLDEHDDDYKDRTYAQLRDAGRVLAAFDNEPTHINGYQEAFPDALNIHLATDHSLRGIQVLEDIPSIRDFSVWID
jgi:predicted secreted acid phosphatase